MSAEMVKICKVHGELTGEKVYLNKGKYKECRLCRTARSCKWKLANPDKVREIYRKNRAKNVDKIREKNRKWNADNPNKVRESTRKHMEECVKNLRDRYIKHILYQAGIKDIMPGMIKSKRLSLIAHRLYKQHHKGEI